MPACPTAGPSAVAADLKVVSRRVARALLIFAAAFAALDVAQAAPTVPIAQRTLERIVLLDVVRAGDRTIAVGEQGYIAISDDQGKTWQRAATPTEATLTAVHFSDPEHGWAVGHQSLILHSSDGGITWQRQSAPQTAVTLLDVWFMNTQHGIAVGAHGAFFRTDDGGHSWHAQVIATGEDRHLNAIAGGVDGKVFIAGEDGLLYGSNDGGTTWARRKTPYGGSYFGVLRLAPREVLVFGLRGHILRSSDDGVTWRESHSNSSASLLGGGSTGSETIVLGGRVGTVLISRDRGKTFSRLASSIRNDYAAVLPLAARSVLLIGQGGPVSRRLSDD